MNSSVLSIYLSIYLPVYHTVRVADCIQSMVTVVSEDLC
jgi:hypothetical protein